MRYFYPELRRTTFTMTALLASTAAFADITPDEVWPYWAEKMANMGMSVDDATVTSTSAGVVVAGARVGFDLGFVSGEIGMPEIRYSDNGAGGVIEEYVGAIGIDIRVEDGGDLSPGAGEVGLSGTVELVDYQAEYTGQIGDMAMVSRYSGMKGNLKSEDETTTIRFDDMSEDAVISTTLRDPAFSDSGLSEYSGKISIAKQVSTNETVNKFEDGEFRSMNETTREDFVSMYTIVLPDLSALANPTPETFATWLDSGFYLDMTASIAAAVSKTKQNLPEEEATQSFDVAANDIVYNLRYDSGLLGFEGSATDFVANFVPSALYEDVLPVTGPVELQGEGYGVAVALPIRPLDAFSDIKFKIDLDQVRVSDNVKEGAGPMAFLLEAPIDKHVEVTASIRMIDDFFQVLDASNSPEVEIESVTLHQLDIAIADATLTGEGAMQFDPPANTTTMEPPVPSAATMQLHGEGILALMARLEELGVTPPNTLAQARLFGQMFQAVDAENDVIDINAELGPDGAPIINGNPVPF